MYITEGRILKVNEHHGDVPESLKLTSRQRNKEERYGSRQREERNRILNIHRCVRRDFLEGEGVHSVKSSGFEHLVILSICGEYNCSTDSSVIMLLMHS